MAQPNPNEGPGTTVRDPARVYYRVINPKSRDYGLTYEYVRTTSRGDIVLLAGSPWHKQPIAFHPSEVEVLSSAK